MGTALRVATKERPLIVARRLFDVAKFLSSRLDWPLFDRYNGNSDSVNRPWPLDSRHV